jgi:hypothetical protein
MITLRMILWVRHGGEEECRQNLVRKPEGKRLHVKHKCRWEDEIKGSYGTRLGRYGLD